MTKEQFTKEFEQARPQLKSYILRITASVQDSEDIVQDVFLEIWRKRDEDLDFHYCFKYYQGQFESKKTLDRKRN